MHRNATAGRQCPIVNVQGLAVYYIDTYLLFFTSFMFNLTY